VGSPSRPIPVMQAPATHKARPSLFLMYTRQTVFGAPVGSWGGGPFPPHAFRMARGSCWKQRKVLGPGLGAPVCRRRCKTRKEVPRNGLSPLGRPPFHSPSPGTRGKRCPVNLAAPVPPPPWLGRWKKKIFRESDPLFRGFTPQPIFHRLAGLRKSWATPGCSKIPQEKRAPQGPLNGAADFRYH